MYFRSTYWPCFLLLLAVFCGFRTPAAAQGMRSEFGKNIIQYKTFEWFYYSTAGFDVYYYTNGKELAQFTLTEAERSLKELEKRIDYPFGDKITFIVYNSFTDFRQSNYRVPDDPNNPGGRTRIQNNKAFLYFNGSHADLSSQIRSGIARIMMNEILYGGNLQEKLQNNVLLNVPDWYINGLVQYIGEDWNTYYESKLRAGIQTERFRRFKKLTEEETVIIGHSLWKYINDKYGPEALSSIIYYMRTNKSIESGYLHVLGKSFIELYDEWYAYHRDRYKSQPGKAPQGEELPVLSKVFKKGTVTHWDLSPRADYAAVVTNDMGLNRLWLVNMATGKKKRLFSEGYRRAGAENFETNYPLVAWNPRQNELTVIYEKKSIPTYFTYNTDTRKRTEDQLIQRIERVLSFSYNENGRLAVMSAVRRGQSDIYLFDFRTQVARPLTDDIYDDLEPRFVHKGRSVVYSSNRPNADNRKVGATGAYTFNDNFDIYLFPDYLAPRLMKRLSNSPANDWMPDAYDSLYFSYITDENGVRNRNAVRLDTIFQHINAIVTYRDTHYHRNDTFRTFLRDPAALRLPERVLKDTQVYSIDTVYVYKDSLYVYPLTDYKNNLLSYEIRNKQGIYELFLEDEKYHLYKVAVPKNIPTLGIERSLRQGFSRSIAPDNRSETPLPDRLPDLQSPTEIKPQTGTRQDSLAQKPYFQSDFPAPGSQAAGGTPASGNVAEQFRVSTNAKSRFPNPIPYSTGFTPDFVITQLDNTIINSPYLPYTPGDPSLAPPTLNGMFKLGMSDLFKDYRFIGGFRILGTLKGAEYFMTYENLRKRVDKRLTFFRRGETKTDGNGTMYRTSSNELRNEYRWPFSETTSLRMSAFGRTDRITYLATDEKTLNQPTSLTLWGGGKLEYVYDNTIARGMNLYNGVRGKAYVESYNAVNAKNLLLGIIGADVRTYTKIHRQFIWANRMAYATSLGTGKVVYYLGGVENWLLPEYNKENKEDPNTNWVYKAQATNMRGFMQNVRNGNTYLVYNTELRMPLFKYIFNRPFRSQFFENFQVVGFADAGSAWSGLNPFSESNSFNKRTVEQGPLKVTVVTRRDPFVAGYGFGFRSVLLGYFLRVDYAWGLEDRAVQPRRVHISLGLDF